MVNLYYMQNRKTTGGLMQVALSVCILVLLALLIGNVTLILMAINLNNYVCKQAAQAGAETYAYGGDQRDLQMAVSHAVNNETAGGFFISPPILAEMKCYTDMSNGHRKQMLLVKTITAVYVPAPFLLFFVHPSYEGRLLLTSKYAIKLKDRSLTGFCPEMNQ
jgi:hypothetical protein